MKALGLWELIDVHEISRLRDAKILDGQSQFEMLIPHQLTQHQELAWFISSHLIRKAGYDAVELARQENHHTALICGHKAMKVSTDKANTKVILDDGLEFNIKLVVAVNNRFSTTRTLYLFSPNN